jgi:hypothetical protein
MTIAVSNNMMNAIRESLKKADPNRDGLIPLQAMAGHFCSLEKGDYKPTYLHLMTLNVDGKQVFIYFRK